MAVNASNTSTLLDVAKRHDPDGKPAKIVEMLQQTNEILLDMQWVEGNLPTGHRTTVRTGLPSVAWRMLNYGVPPSKSTTAQVDDSCGMLEAYAEVDKALADLNGNTASFRLSEDAAFLEAMNQEMAQTLFYGNPTADPKKFLGLSTRYSDRVNAPNKRNIIDGGGTGTSNTSIWLVTWGPNTCHGIYPKGLPAGLQHRDLGEVTLEDGNGGKYQGYRTHYGWNCGVTLRDWRYVVRIPNIDLNAATPADLIKLMVIATKRIPNIGMGNTTFYCNRDVSTMLDLQAMEKKNVLLAVGEEEGRPKTTLRGIPIRTCDILLNTEGRV